MRQKMTLLAIVSRVFAALLAGWSSGARADQVPVITETSTGASGNPAAAAANVSATLDEEDWIDSASNRPAIIAESAGGTGLDGAALVTGFGENGGDGGRGGTVTVSSQGDIDTQGQEARGVFARSVGGNAGAGGLGVVIGGAGGHGGIGGNGNVVLVEVTGDITTQGTRGIGVDVSSRGGRGGDGGVGGGVGGVGGWGERGGHAARVSVDNRGAVTTAGLAATGIMANSDGGNGGTGNVGAGLGGVGGGGGAGGAGSWSHVTNHGDITITGDFSTPAYGIFVRSTGGRGGDGGVGGGVGGVGGGGGAGAQAGFAEIFNYGGVSTRSDRSHALTASSIGGAGGNAATGGGAGGVGASGGNGAAGGAVEVTNHGALATHGDNSVGVRARSEGGAGGAGAVGAGAGGVAGSGGEAGNAGRAEAANHGAISTQGENAHGILAQSVGGAGGAAGFGGGVGGIGGTGERGGNSAQVEVVSSGEIVTHGRGAMGIVAISEAGDGGAGGDANGAGGIGGAGGRGGTAGRVEVHNSGAITTSGEAGRGIAASSLGGAGGSGGDGQGVVGIGGAAAGSGPGGAVAVENHGEIRTRGAHARGIHGESIGGHVGTGGEATGLISYGGDANSSGSAGAVSILNHAAVTTEGEFSTALFAESTGGGGGTGGLSGGLFNTIGGRGAASGNGGSVSIDNTGTLSTSMTDAHGIFAHSVGGGGGNGGGSLSTSAWLGTSFGGVGDSGGNGGSVAVTSGASSINTLGDRAYGIYAESQGGGGGYGGWSIALSGGAGGSLSWSMGGRGAGGGHAGVVDVANGSDIGTLGGNAHGIYAVSRGGGGGSGGFSISGAGSDGIGLAVSIGGFAGGGGNASSVNVVNTAERISTAGAYSNAIFAQSVGGGGGNGGFSIAAAGGGAGAGTFNMGGRGGAGGHGDEVYVENHGGLSTTNYLSTALYAQSLGGGGGNGGFAIGLAAAGTGAGTVNIGGWGGDGGNAAGVTVVNHGDIVTSGIEAKGIEAQSQGGGGGNGGFSISGAGAGTGSGSVNLGGFGGGGGSSSAVLVDNHGSIATLRDNATGLFAQSLGGGGGNGGFSITGAVAGTGSGSLSVGGFGGDGGSAGVVDVTNSGELIWTSGARANGITAESQGGGGGNGHFSISAVGTQYGGTLSVGGQGGGGGNGDGVSVTNDGRIVTEGDHSLGIFAHSIGGGGGDGGFSISGAVSTGIGGGLSVGGSGGRGGDSVRSDTDDARSTVQVNHAGAIETAGAGSSAIFAQSIGGGGGKGAFSVGASVGTGTQHVLSALGLSVGGCLNFLPDPLNPNHVCSGGDGGTVDVAASGSITTHGDAAHGIHAESEGGGGGSAGWSVSGTSAMRGAISASVGGFGGGGGDGADVTVTTTGESQIDTAGHGSMGIRARSIGGGGGDGGYSVAGSLSLPGDIRQMSASVGGSGGAGGDSGNVTITAGGSLTTEGDDAIGIFAQSIGGGGGEGRTSFAGAIDLTPTASGTSSLQISASVGGSGGDGGSAGERVRVETLAGSRLSTQGRDASGIVAQSIGGGGGIAGNSVAAIFDVAAQAEARSVDISVAVGGAGGSGGRGNTVEVDNGGDIETAGDAAHGIYAQSVGGGGGIGGGAVAAAIIARTETPGQKWAGNFAVGGLGGDGNVGGQVDVRNQGNITTHGAAAHGIVAESIGGGGGDGGNANAVSFALGLGCHVPVISGLVCPSAPEPANKPVYTGRVGVGGFGGDGNDGGAVLIENAGAIRVDGFASAGILAQSIGHGGGNGGNASTSISGVLPTLGGVDVAAGLAGIEGVTIDNSGSPLSLSGASVTVGGLGGGSGSGGDVIVTNRGDIATTAQDGLITFEVPWLGNSEVTIELTASSSAIVAQSIGGGGGSGGLSNAGVTGLVSVGGWGGASGDGGIVTVTNEGSLSTVGGKSYGILAQSIGGGGGLSEATELDPETDPASGGSCAGLICIGGSGGAHGDGGAVTITNDGGIHTRGDMSRGIMAQSIGGGGGALAGGTGTSLPLAIAFAGIGGAGGHGGAVTITNNHFIRTEGESANAIFAESLGGGGGSFNGSLATLSLGGASGSSGDGGAVEIFNHGLLATSGHNASAIHVASIGGGGGAHTFSGVDGTSRAIIGLGARAGASGNGGTVTVDNAAEGVITTFGDNSHGIHAQSIGGGGGNSSMTGSLLELLAIGREGGEGGTGGAVTVTNRGIISTNGRRSGGIVATSVGGGGGDGSLTYTGATVGLPILPIAFAIGGAGGSGGDGGEVVVENLEGASISARGASSTGIFAQSVGGGGGSGGVSLVQVGQASLTLGGSGAAGGDGGDVTATNDARITLRGDNSIGILAQSIGGGGGASRNDFAIPTVFDGVDVQVVPAHIGGAEGASGSGGNVAVTNSGAIVIQGDNSVGLFAQSVGGGGGLAQVSGGAAQVETLDGGIGNGGTQTITNTGNIRIIGRGGVALLAQSIGGGGGALLGVTSSSATRFTGTSGGSGTAADVVLDLTGDLIAADADSIALLAQSDSSDGRGNLTVNIRNRTPEVLSAITGGAGGGAGVMLLGGADNRLNNAGFISNAHRFAGFAIVGDVGNNTVHNTGVVTGSIDLGSGNGVFINDASGGFASGDIVDLGGGSLTNAGLLAPGYIGNVHTTRLNGSLVQEAGGVLAVDLDARRTTDATDRLQVSATAQLEGEVVLNVLQDGYAVPGARTMTLIEAEEGLTHGSLVLSAPDSAVASYTLRYPDARRIELSYDIDFAAGGALNRNQTKVGETINALQRAGGSVAFAPLAAGLLELPDTDSLAAAYDRLSPEIYAGNETGALFSALGFNDSMMSCRAVGGQFHLAREDACTWLRMGLDGFNQKATGENLAFNRDSLTISGGSQWELTDAWHIGFALGYGFDSVRTGVLSNSDGRQLNAGLVAKWRSGNTTLAASLAGGRLEYETRRLSGLVGSGEQSISNPETRLGAAHLRLGHVFDRGAWYLRPLLDVGYNYLDTPAFAEEGGSGATLSIASRDHTAWSVQPELEFGVERALSSSAQLRTWLRAGVLRWMSGTTPEVSAFFQDAPAGTPAMTVSGRSERDYANLSLGVSLLSGEKIELRFDYTGRFSGETTHQGAGLKFSTRF